MKDYILSCCSTADLKKEHLDEKDIRYIYFHYSLDGVAYYDDLGQTMPLDRFYKTMADGAKTSTSQINISEYLDYFSSFLSEGKDVLHVCLSSGLSGTYNCAVNAANIARERFPGRKIYVVDSLGASSGYGLLIDAMADLRNNGMEIEELRDWAEANKLSVHHLFFSTDLSYYVKGGRISRAAGLAGGILGICPVLHVDASGRLIPIMKARSKKKAMREIVDLMVKNARGGPDYSGKCFISHSACLEDACAVADLVKDRFAKLGGVVINDIGTTIGSHTGPGTTAMFFWGSERVK
jgi:DegV family protein with EDD domain